MREKIFYFAMVLQVFFTNICCISLFSLRAEFLNCSKDFFTCNDGSCATLSALCNNLQDCTDNSDELICGKK